MSAVQRAPGLTEPSVDDYVKRYGGAVIGRMLAENALDTSDDEIQRTLFRCVGAHFLIPVAKRMRELGTLVLDASALSNALGSKA